MLMASSKVMASRSQPNPDVPRQPSPSHLHIQSDQGRGFGSMNMEEIFKNIYEDSGSFAIVDDEGGGGGGGSSAVDGGSHVGGVRNENKTVDEVWRDIVSGAATGGGVSSGVDDGAGDGGGGGGRMTLEDFLAKARVLNEEEVMVQAVGTITPPPSTTACAFGMESMMNPATGVPAIQFAPAVCPQKGLTTGGFGVEFANGIVPVSGGNGNRGKRKAALEEVPLDKATQQKQRRMIKNRESAARSRERKQAYTVELESMVTQLEEDNARLLKEEAALMKERYNQLMTNLIPVTEKPRPPRILRRVHSMTW